MPRCWPLLGRKGSVHLAKGATSHFETRTFELSNLQWFFSRSASWQKVFVAGFENVI